LPSQDCSSRSLGQISLPKSPPGFVHSTDVFLPTSGNMDSMQVPGQPQQGLQASCMCHYLPPSLSERKTRAAHLRLIGMQAAQHPTFADFGTGNHGHGTTPNHESCNLYNITMACVHLHVLHILAPLLAWCIPAQCCIAACWNLVGVLSLLYLQHAESILPHTGNVVAG
jgi:hypothetical protein